MSDTKNQPEKQPKKYFYRVKQPGNSVYQVHIQKIITYSFQVEAPSEEKAREFADEVWDVE